MKTIFSNIITNNFNNFSFDVLTSADLSMIKGGKEVDVYIDPTPRFANLTFPFVKSNT